LQKIWGVSDVENRDADDVERHPCPRCQAQPGSPCRSRSGAVAGTYHTGRFTKVPRLAKQLRVTAPADRRPGQPWRPGTPPPAPLALDTPSADIRIGYARCSTLTQELQSQLNALAARGIDPDKVFAEKVNTRVRVRPKFEAALALARQIKAHAPHCRVILTVYEMKRLGRDAAELTALADHLTAHGLVLEMLAGHLPGIWARRLCSCSSTTIFDLVRGVWVPEGRSPTRPASTRRSARLALRVKIFEAGCSRIC
jgi:hypothetical protein